MSTRTTQKAVPNWHSQSMDAALQQLDVASNSGLSHQEATQRLEQHGRNSLPAPKRRGPWLRFALQFHNPLIYVLLGAGVVTFALNDYVDAGVIAFVVFINALILLPAVDTLKSSAKVAQRQ